MAFIDGYSFSFLEELLALYEVLYAYGVTKDRVYSGVKVLSVGRGIIPVDVPSKSSVQDYLNRQPLSSS